MLVMHTIADIRLRLRGVNGITLVPTMGNLHQGHLDLVRIARQLGQFVVVSIFVNPLQFGVNEDFFKYPRTLDQDCKLLEVCGADLVFAPSESDMYPQPQQVKVALPPIANELCGAFRPGHFSGAATVVLKLFNIIQPEIAVFGKKDYQQYYLMRQMSEQLNLPVKIVSAETLRAPDGLALSSRNQYLKDEERTEAVFLYQMLTGVRQAILKGEKDFGRLQVQGLDALVSRGWRAEYVEIRSQSNLAKPRMEERNLVILAAAWLGKTRLIDNLEVFLDDGSA